MDTFMEDLTTTEAAVAAGVSLPQINRVIDERILPDDWYSTSPVRTFRTDACLFIAFYYETADWLTASARLQTIRNAAAHRSSWDAWRNYAVDLHFLILNFDDLWKTVNARLHKWARAVRGGAAQNLRLGFFLSAPHREAIAENGGVSKLEFGQLSSFPLRKN